MDKAEVVLTVRGEPFLHSWRVAESCAADASWGSLGEKFAARLRNAALIAIFTQYVSTLIEGTLHLFAGARTIPLLACA